MAVVEVMPVVDAGEWLVTHRWEMERGRRPGCLRSAASIGMASGRSTGSFPARNGVDHPTTLADRDGQSAAPETQVSLTLTGTTPTRRWTASLQPETPGPVRAGGPTLSWTWSPPPWPTLMTVTPPATTVTWSTWSPALTVGPSWPTGHHWMKSPRPACLVTPPRSPICIATTVSRCPWAARPGSGRARSAGRRWSETAGIADSRACGRRIVDLHHLWAWEDGGPTDLANGCFQCRRHHRLLHAGFRAIGHPNATLTFYRPDHTIIGSTAPTSGRSLFKRRWPQASWVRPDGMVSETSGPRLR